MASNETSAKWRLIGKISPSPLPGLSTVVLSHHSSSRSYRSVESPPCDYSVLPPCNLSLNLSPPLDLLPLHCSCPTYDIVALVRVRCNVRQCLSSYHSDTTGQQHSQQALPLEPLRSIVQSIMTTTPVCLADPCILTALVTAAASTLMFCSPFFTAHTSSSRPPNRARYTRAAEAADLVSYAPVLARASARGACMEHDN